MIVFYYDKTFEGLLSALFDAFKRKIVPDELLSHDEIAPLLVINIHYVKTEKNKYERIQMALKKRLASISLHQLICVWLSEKANNDMLIFRYIYKLFKSESAIETNFADPDVLKIRQIALKVDKERQHIMQFVRFNVIEQNNDKVHEQIYFSLINPIYNVLPLTTSFFQDRFADQKWVIYDKNRHYGYFYYLQKVELISMEAVSGLLINGKINPDFFSSDEAFFQNMWRRYCEALTIKERINFKLQRHLMPKRFWDYLPEMKN